MRKLNLFFLCFLAISIVNAVELNDTLVWNTKTNYSFYVNDTIYFDQLIVSDEGRIEIYNITSNLTEIPILHNINNTYTSIIDFYGLNKALITKNDGTVGCTNVEICSGNQNISIPTNGWIKVYDNYNVETGTTPSDPRPDDPISSGTSGSGRNQTTTLNSSLSSTVNFSVSGLINALIYNNTYSVLASTNINDNDGNINLTIRGNEVIYILNNYDKEENYFRDYDPIYFTSSTSTSKHIASNLSNQVIVSVSVNVADCDTAGDIYYTPNGSANTYKYSRGSYTCSNKVVTFAALPINSSSSSNEMLIYYNGAQLEVCSDFFSTGSTMIDFLIIFIIVGIGGFLVMMLMSGNSDIDLGGMGIIVLIAMLIISLGMTIINAINGC